MRTVQFTQHLTQHFRKIVVIVDIRQEALISFFVSIPVRTLQVCHIELIIYLLPDVVEDIFTLTIRAVIEESLKFNWRNLAAFNLYLLHSVAGTKEDILPFLVRLQSACTYFLQKNFCNILFQIVLPKIVPILKNRQIIEFIPFSRKHGICHMRGIDGQAYNTVKAVCEIELQRLYLFLLIFVGILFFLLGILFVFLPGFFLLCLLHFLKQSGFFLVHQETVVCFSIKEHDISIVFGSPTAVAAIPRTVTGPNHGFSTQYPFGIAIVVSALGQVHHFTLAIGIQQHNIFVVPSTYTDIVRKNPFAVRTPLKPLVTVRIRVLILAIHNGTHILCLQIDDTDGAAVFEKGNLFTVRAVLGLERSGIRVCQAFFLQLCGIGKQLFILTHNRRSVKLPKPATFGSINQCPPIGGKVYGTFLTRSIRYLLRSLIFH